MTAGWITVSPMHQPSFRVPFVLSIEFDDVARNERRDSWGETDVVGDQDCLTRTQTDDESLVPTAVVVIREQPNNYSLALNLDIADVIPEGTGQN